MRIISRILLLSTFLFVLAPISAQSIPIADAKNHLGEWATVCGKVFSEQTVTNRKGKPTFLNLDAPYPHQAFTLVIWEEDKVDIGPLPREGSRVCATGKIQSHNGIPEIAIRSSWQLSH